MEAESITKENLNEYEALIPSDIAENIGRRYYRALGVEDEDSGEPEAVLIWKLKTSSENQVSSEITWISSKSDRALSVLFEEYNREALQDKVVKTFFEIPLSPGLNKILSDQGFSVEEREGRDLTVSVGELSQLEIAKGKVPDNIKSLGDLPLEEYRQGIIKCLLIERKGLLEDLSFLPMAYFDPDVSSTACGRENGFLLVHVTPDGVLRVELLFASEPDARSRLATMIRRSIQSARDKYPPDTRVVLRRHNDASAGLVKSLFPEKKGEIMLAGSRMEMGVNG